MLVVQLQFKEQINRLIFITCFSSSVSHFQFILQFAGAAQSLGAGAILVNPWNITEVANSIAQALNMPSEEREKRHKHNFIHVTTHTAQEWAETFVRYACLSFNMS